MSDTEHSNSKLLFVHCTEKRTIDFIGKLSIEVCKCFIEQYETQLTEGIECCQLLVQASAYVVGTTHCTLVSDPRFMAILAAKLHPTSLANKRKIVHLFHFWKILRFLFLILELQTDPINLATLSPDRSPSLPRLISGTQTQPRQIPAVWNRKDYVVSDHQHHKKRNSQNPKPPLHKIANQQIIHLTYLPHTQTLPLPRQNSQPNIPTNLCTGLHPIIPSPSKHK